MGNELGGLPFERGPDLRELVGAARLVQEFAVFIIRHRRVGRRGDGTVFLVHGHDEGAREGAARYLEGLGLKVVVLAEAASGGMTIVEKLEQCSDVEYAVLILSPDDCGYPAGHPEALARRARQNVLFETGYFVGTLGRRRVCLLLRGELELPTDLNGIVYIAFDTTGGWKRGLWRELRQVGLKVAPDWA